MVRTSGEWDYYAHRRHINQPGNQAESRLLAGCKGGGPDDLHANEMYTPGNGGRGAGKNDDMGDGRL